MKTIICVISLLFFVSNANNAQANTLFDYPSGGEKFIQSQSITLLISNSNENDYYNVEIWNPTQRQWSVLSESTLIVDNSIEIEIPNSTGKYFLLKVANLSDNTFSLSNYFSILPQNNQKQSVTIDFDENENFSELIIYPNPTSNNFSISDNYEVINTMLVSMNGIVYDVNIQNNNVSVDEVPDGVYLFIVNTSEGIKSSKIIIKR